jgi:hypothetical protein
LQALTAADRAALLDELLPRLEEYTRGRPESWAKLERFQDHAARGAAARFRLEVREAALQRMRTILVGIAGRVLIANDGQRQRERDGLARLQRCEAFTPGEPPDSSAAPRSQAARPFPPLSTELALLEEISPSWLGVQFRRLAEPFAPNAVCGRAPTCSMRSTRTPRSRRPASTSATSSSGRRAGPSTRRGSCASGR